MPRRVYDTVMHLRCCFYRQYDYGNIVVLYLRHPGWIFVIRFDTSCRTKAVFRQRDEVRTLSIKISRERGCLMAIPSDRSVYSPAFGSATIKSSSFLCKQIDELSEELPLELPLSQRHDRLGALMGMIRKIFNISSRAANMFRFSWRFIFRFFYFYRISEY